MKFYSRLLAIVLIISILITPISLSAQVFYSENTPTPTAIINATAGNEDFNYNDYYDSTPSDFLSKPGINTPTAVMEATERSGSLRDLTLSVMNFGLGFLAMISTLETGYGIVTMNPYHIIDGGMTIIKVMIGYAFINTLLMSNPESID